MKTKVTAIIPTYNRAQFLIRAMNSVLAQTYRDLELIIVDDGSEDDTERIVMGTMAENPDFALMYFKTANRGVSAARNHGIQCASGEWIAFLDSDDIWTPKKIDTQVQFLASHPAYRFVHHGERWYRNGRRVNPPKIYEKFGGDVFRQCLPLCMIGASTVMMEKSLLEELGGFDENFPVCEDYDLWLKVSAQWPVGLIRHELTWKYGGHDAQLSRTHLALDYWRIRALCGILSTAELDATRKEAVYLEIMRKARILLTGYRKHGREQQYDAAVKMIDDAVPEFIRRQIWT